MLNSRQPQAVTLLDSSPGEIGFSMPLANHLSSNNTTYFFEINGKWTYILEAWQNPRATSSAVALLPLVQSAQSSKERLCGIRLSVFPL
jgi:hypothetical protein